MKIFRLIGMMLISILLGACGGIDRNPEQSAVEENESGDMVYTVSRAAEMESFNVITYGENKIFIHNDASLAIMINFDAFQDGLEIDGPWTVGEVYRWGDSERSSETFNGKYLLPAKTTMFFRLYSSVDKETVIYIDKLLVESDDIGEIRETWLSDYANTPMTGYLVSVSPGETMELDVNSFQDLVLTEFGIDSRALDVVDNDSPRGVNGGEKITIYNPYDHVMYRVIGISQYNEREGGKYNILTQKIF